MSRGRYARADGGPWVRVRLGSHAADLAPRHRRIGLARAHPHALADHRPDESEALRILHKRLAGGEIDVEQFKARRAPQLDGSGKGNRMLRVRSAADINGASIQRWIEPAVASKG